ncbi:MAG: hypothetical protein M3R25_07865 [Bacteroidota bacterium]|nr:hypothetical protein [Bacteroidota bacterium]
MQPSGPDKSPGDVLFIDIEFESHTGENVEHINVKIVDDVSSAIVYSMPDDAHVPDYIGTYEFTDQITLSTANGFYSGDWVLETSFWCEHESQEAEVERVEFHVKP